MPEETQSVRITQAQIYEKLLEINEVQIEMVAELRGLRDLPGRVNEIEQQVARMEWLEKLAFAALGSGVTGFIAALWSLIA